MTNICPTCGARALKQGVHLYQRVLDGQRFTAELPSRSCGACGEELTSGPAGVKADDAISLALARGCANGPEGFRWLRRSAGLASGELARLLDVTPGQVSRWENGRKPLERRAVALVSAMAIERIEGKPAALEMLRTLASPKRKAPKSVRVLVPATRGAPPVAG